MIPYTEILSKKISERISGSIEDQELISTFSCGDSERNAVARVLPTRKGRHIVYFCHIVTIIDSFLVCSGEASPYDCAR